MNGVLNIYKPQKMSSFDVVRKIRNLSHTKKLVIQGHLIRLHPEYCLFALDVPQKLLTIL